VSRPEVAIGLAVVSIAGLSAVQWTVTSPGVLTEVEWHTLLLCSVPALVVVLSAYWVDDGRRR
jgi:hypothetical protein